MQATRRDFLKASTVGGVAASVLGFDLAPAYAQVRDLKIARTTETRSTCPYCSVSCGVIIHTLGDRSRNVTPAVVHIEGDADHPINQGTLCPKGITLKQNIVNDRRLTSVRYRAPGSRVWEEKTKGGGGNTSIFVMSDGVLVVDAKNAGWGQTILAKVKELTPKPVVRIINTHSHGDHTSGNVEFPATVDIVTHENTKANMDQMRPVTGFAVPATPPPNIFKVNNGKGMPKRTFKDKMTIGSGADQVDLYYFGRGHTDGDAWVHYPALRILHIADIFANKGIPTIDLNNGGSVVQVADSLAKGASTLTAVDTIIPGHSPAMFTMKDLQEFIEFHRQFVADVRAAKKAGKTAEETAKTWTIPAKYAGYATPQPARLLINVQAVYDEK